MAIIILQIMVRTTGVTSQPAIPYLTAFFNLALARYYVTDDFMIVVVQTYDNGRAAGVVRAEWLLAQFQGRNIAPTLFVSSLVDADDNSSVMGGPRIYFGNHDKPLIRCHR